MPLYDYEWPDGHITEEFKPVEDEVITCPHCGCSAKRRPAVPRVNVHNQDAPWIRSASEVVNKKGGPHCQAFVKDPTRENYHAWMKAEGVRHLEDNEPMAPLAEVDLSGLKKKMIESHIKRQRIEVITE